MQYRTSRSVCRPPTREKYQSRHCCTGVPHLRQNFAPARMLALHDTHVMSDAAAALPSLTGEVPGTPASGTALGSATATASSTTAAATATEADGGGGGDSAWPVVTAAVAADGVPEPSPGVVAAAGCCGGGGDAYALGRYGDAAAGYSLGRYGDAPPPSAPPWPPCGVTGYGRYAATGAIPAEADAVGYGTNGTAGCSTAAAGAGAGAGTGTGACSCAAGCGAAGGGDSTADTAPATEPRRSGAPSRGCIAKPQPGQNLACGRHLRPQLGHDGCDASCTHARTAHNEQIVRNEKRTDN
jgi:hypothetical protein